MPLYTQAGRLISLTTPLGDDKLLLTGFTGHEAMSRLFHFHLTTLSEDTAVDFTQIVGQSVTIDVTQADDSKRHFNGIVSHFAHRQRWRHDARTAGGAETVDLTLRRLPHLT
jgi:type VI secretion system secreted protein VgrG